LDGEGWDKSTRVQGQERLWLVVGVDFDVFIGDVLLLESDPDALDCSFFLVKTVL
jgi:hypothetical protein